jgi:hypothetical protein
MASYYIQNAKYRKNSNYFYGTQTAHNHDSQTAFSQTTRNYMELHYNAAPADIELGQVRKNQSRPPRGANVVQLRFVDGGWVW